MNTQETDCKRLHATGCALRKSLPRASAAALALSVAALAALTPLARAADRTVTTAAVTTAPEMVSATGGAVTTTGPLQDITVSVSRSTVIPTPWPVKRVSVTDPKIADVQVLTPKQVLVSGLAVGTTDVFMWSKDEEMWQARIDVEIDRAAIKKELAKLFPNANLDLRQARDLLVISGLLARAEEAEQLHRFLNSYGVKYVDMTKVAGIQQVQLKVVIAEANRTAIRALGINAFVAGTSFFGGSTIGPDGGGPINPVDIGKAAGSAVGSQSFQFLNPTNVSSAVTLFGGIPGSDLQFFISALNENQYLRVLAEPSLVALSGQDANFLAGGEFPIPVVQGGGGGNNNTSITIEYKEFGVRLKFRPTVLGDGTIRLQVAPEVSQLSQGPGAVTISGFTVPALITRRAETTLELGSGQTFGMAGLINQTIEARNSKVPGLGEVPVLGALFRSVRYKKGDTELLILVTATLVEPISPAKEPPLPGLLHLAPNDWELYAMGQIDGKIPPKVGPIECQYLKDTGLSRLRGPGAWATFESPAGISTAPLHPKTDAPKNTAKEE